MKTLNACCCSLNLPMLDCALQNSAPDDFLFLIGAPAQRCSYIALHESLKSDQAKKAYDFPFIINRDRDDAVLEVWALARDMTVRCILRIEALAVPVHASL